MYSERDSIWKEELEQNGIFIENVCSTRKSGTFFLCMSKALIMFMILIGTVIGCIFHGIQQAGHYHIYTYSIMSYSNSFS